MTKKEIVLKLFDWTMKAIYVPIAALLLIKDIIFYFLRELKSFKILTIIFLCYELHSHPESQVLSGVMLVALGWLYHLRTAQKANGG